jgi:hypothetical protein
MRERTYRITIVTRDGDGDDIVRFAAAGAAAELTGGRVIVEEVGDDGYVMDHYDLDAVY